MIRCKHPRRECIRIDTLTNLQHRWRNLYQNILPALAASQDSVQELWPVHLDHCFARIVLDRTVGIDRPWTEVVRRPAIEHMTSVQLEAVVQLAEEIATGQADLVALNERSLHLRGKPVKRKTADDDPMESPEKKTKIKKAAPSISAYFLPSPGSPPKVEDQAETRSTSPPTKLSQSSLKQTATSLQNLKRAAEEDQPEDMSSQLQLIADSPSLTPFRKLTLRLLCQIPRGRYSTYGNMATFISQASHKTCARAVGNAMRNNPFAPQVPCHRILAGDRSLGGFKGDWGEEGQFAKLKHELLSDERLRFDSRGKVQGVPFQDFVL